VLAQGITTNPTSTDASDVAVLAQWLYLLIPMPAISAEQCRSGAVALLEMALRTPMVQSQVPGCCAALPKRASPQPTPRQNAT
jgi:hypothetical protein